MTKNTTDELDRLLSGLIQRLITPEDFKTAIEALISNREKLARMEEIEEAKIVADTDKMTIKYMRGALNRRLASLRKELDGGRDE